MCISCLQFITISYKAKCFGPSKAYAEVLRHTLDESTTV